MALKTLPVTVIGHKNPDTDSICSAIAYTHLKNTLEGGGYRAARAGDINRETKFVLNRFGVKAPELEEDVGAQVRDLDVRELPGAAPGITMHEALVRMRDEQISTLPVVDDESRLLGIVTINTLAVANMDMTRDTLARGSTPLENVMRTLGAALVCGTLEQTITEGKVVMGSGSPELIEKQIEAGDIVICGNRYDSQLCAIEMRAACVIICSDAPVAKTIIMLAKEHDTTILTTPLDPFDAACMINQSVSISNLMFRKGLITFRRTDPVDTAREVMSKSRVAYFPVLDREDRYRGIVSHRNLMNLRRRRLILVDHNERTQCVDGHEQAEILEIIDHHRIKSVETDSPVYFRNQPVGCTATIIRQIYAEQGIPVPPDMAGILCSAILSDTLMFRSPTCTPLDESTARELAGIAGVEIEPLANEMFEAGENVEGRTPENVFYQDFKRFTGADYAFGVGQGSFLTRTNLSRAEEIVRGYMAEAMRRENLPMMFFLLTDITTRTSRCLFLGEHAEELLTEAFPCTPENGACNLAGVVSRKKQFIPKLLAAMQD